MTKYISVLLLTVVSSSMAFAADKAMHEGGGGPTPLEYQMTEQANKKLQDTGDSSGYDEADEAAEKEKLRKALSDGMPDVHDATEQ